MNLLVLSSSGVPTSASLYLNSLLLSACTVWHLWPESQYLPNRPHVLCLCSYVTPVSSCNAPTWVFALTVVLLVVACILMVSRVCSVIWRNYWRPLHSPGSARLMVSPLDGRSSRMLIWTTAIPILPPVQMSAARVSLVSCRHYKTTKNKLQLKKWHSDWDVTQVVFFKGFFCFVFFCIFSLY